MNDLVVARGNGIEGGFSLACYMKYISDSYKCICMYFVCLFY